MTPDQATVLKSAITRAIAGGFTGLGRRWDTDIYQNTGLSDSSEPFIKEYVGDGEDYRVIPWQVIVFNREFAQSLWGNKDYSVYKVSVYSKNAILDHIPAWWYYLQQLVVANDPIAYLASTL